MSLPAFVSLGAGVQSTTVALLAELGELEPTPEAAIFADTRWEPPEVYAHLAWLEETIQRFPIVRVSAGSLRDNVLEAARGQEVSTGAGYAAPPLHLRPDGFTARQCTYQFKLRPIAAELRRRGYGGRTGRRVESWLGISLDEVQRIKPARLKWQENRWPLVELGMTRHDCLLWLERHGFPRPPRSACVGCPLHSNHDWRSIKADPDLWADAVEVDEAIRTMPRIDGEAFLHHSKRPLVDVDLSTLEDHGQMTLDECEGACFV